MGVTHYPLPLTKGNLLLPFFGDNYRTGIPFINAYISILTGSPG